MISIIIPVLNEAETIVSILQHLDRTASSSNISEVIIVDGGSDDKTISLVNSIQNSLKLKLELVHSLKGRALQMNAGAEVAEGSVLYFLHADSHPPVAFDELILNKVDKGYDAGCFRMKFDSDHPVLKLSQWFTQFNWKLCRGGDQSLFITRSTFDELGGFDTEYLVYEDCELIGRIYDQYKFAIIKEPLTTSARKYEQMGTVRLQFYFAIIHLKNFMGASPEELHGFYKRKISNGLDAKTGGRMLIRASKKTSG